MFGEGLSEEEAAFYLAFFALYTVGVDPLNFEEVVQIENWRNAMDAEISFYSAFFTLYTAGADPLNFEEVVKIENGEMPWMQRLRQLGKMASGN